MSALWRAIKDMLEKLEAPVKEMWETFWFMVDAAATKGTDIAKWMAQVKADGQTRIEVYLKCLKRYAFMVIILPIPILVVGVIGHMGWLVGLVGIFWAVCTAVLGLLFLPLGGTIEMLTGGVKGSGKRYVLFVGSILLTELMVVLYVSEVPLGNNMGAIPALIITAVIFAIALPRVFRAIMVGAAVLIFLGLTISFFIPKGEIVAVLKGRASTSQPAKIVVLRTQLEPGEWSVWSKHDAVPGAVRYYTGPADTEVEFGDGEKVLITEISGNKTPTYRFYSDTGGELKVLLEK